jgi:hypothetical protein
VDDEEDKFRDILSRVRMGAVNHADVNWCNKKVVTSITEESLKCLDPKKTLYVAPTNKVADSINERALLNLTNKGTKLIHVWARNHLKGGLDTNKYTVAQVNTFNRKLMATPGPKEYYKDKKNVDSNKKWHEPHLQFAVGSRVMTTENITTELGVVNGALGTVKGILYQRGSESHPIQPNILSSRVAALVEPMIPIILVQFDTLCDRYVPVSYSKTDVNVIPIAATVSHLPNGAERWQLPLCLASCITIHKSQGQSIDNLVLVLQKMFWARGLPYVAESRVTSSKGLFFLKTPEKCYLETSDFNIKPTSYLLINAALASLQTELGPETNRIYDFLGATPKWDPMSVFDDYTEFTALVEAEETEDPVMWEDLESLFRTGDASPGVDDDMCLVPLQELPDIFTVEIPPVFEDPPAPLPAPSTIPPVAGNRCWHLPSSDHQERVTLFNRDCMLNEARSVTAGQNWDTLCRYSRGYASENMTDVDQKIDCVMFKEDFATIANRRGELSSTSIEMFLHSIPRRASEMENAFVVPDDFYKALTNNWTGYNFEDARNWSVYFPLNFFERPMLFTINTSPTGSHWVFTIIDPRNPNTRTLIFIDPYHRVTEFARRVVENLNTWYKNEVKLHTNEHIPDLTPQYWNPELPEQPQHDGYNCGVFCAMYQYYLLRYNKFPTREDFTSADMPMLRDFMTHTILNGRHMTV